MSIVCASFTPANLISATLKGKIVSRRNKGSFASTGRTSTPAAGSHGTHAVNCGLRKYHFRVESRYTSMTRLGWKGDVDRDPPRRYYSLKRWSRVPISAPTMPLLNGSTGGSGTNASIPIGSCLWTMPGARSRRGEGTIMSAVLTPRLAGKHQPNLLHLPGLTPADEGRRLTLNPDMKPGDRHNDAEALIATG